MGRPPGAFDDSLEYDVYESSQSRHPSSNIGSPTIIRAFPSGDESDSGSGDTIISPSSSVYTSAQSSPGTSAHNLESSAGFALAVTTPDAGRSDEFPTASSVTTSEELPEGENSSNANAASDTQFSAISPLRVLKRVDRSSPHTSSRATSSPSSPIYGLYPCPLNIRPRSGRQGSQSRFRPYANESDGSMTTVIRNNTVGSGRTESRQSSSSSGSSVVSLVFDTGNSSLNHASSSNSSDESEPSDDLDSGDLETGSPGITPPISPRVADYPPNTSSAVSHALSDDIASNVDAITFESAIARDTVASTTDIIASPPHTASTFGSAIIHSQYILRRQNSPDVPCTRTSDSKYLDMFSDFDRPPLDLSLTAPDVQVGTYTESVSPHPGISRQPRSRPPRNRPINIQSRGSPYSSPTLRSDSPTSHLSPRHSYTVSPFAYTEYDPTSGNSISDQSPSPTQPTDHSVPSLASSYSRSPSRLNLYNSRGNCDTPISNSLPSGPASSSSISQRAISTSASSNRPRKLLSTRFSMFSISAPTRPKGSWARSMSIGAWSTKASDLRDDMTRRFGTFEQKRARYAKQGIVPYEET